MTKSRGLRVSNALATLERLIAIQTDECVLWPTGKPGVYPKIKIGSIVERTHVEACRRAYGERPVGLEAAHSCGVTMCVNQRHLQWKTPKENMADQLVHGTRKRGEVSSKLTEEQVREIRRLRGVPQQMLAQRFGVSQTTISDIQRGRRWSWLV